MIPRDCVTAWRANAPWVEDAPVEQDLVIRRALVEMFSHPLLARSLAFRGGTALYKRYLSPAARYSEDIDPVQMEAGPAGAVMDAIQATLNPWLGKPRWKQTRGRVTFRYSFESDGAPPLKMRLKVEINTREHVAVIGRTRRSFGVRSRWFERTASIPTFELDELLATKLRALYQHKKGRDLFDLVVALGDVGSDPQGIVHTFRSYMAAENYPITWPNTGKLHDDQRRTMAKRKTLRRSRTSDPKGPLRVVGGPMAARCRAHSQPSRPSTGWQLRSRVVA